ncbi:MULTISPECIES: peptidoglycan-binding domain-containing protein [Actinotignum]|uniref:peptidoglycan-binding domain-containing protein n=1 Tax=Actinotignum TaxID=1653174 RepID=UPI00255176DF|nr:peptidoglycan-binding domain-containing protein [Actinotignum timonense]MDK6927077.1 peptidoglycan-binding domain-containing protein [Actinotignum timonense]
MNKKIIQILAGVITLLLVAALAFWAGRTTLKPPERITQTGAETMTVTVTEQNIGRTLTLSTTVERAAQPVAVNQLNGTITSVAADGEFHAGDTLYTVGNTEVIAAEGSTPFWRPLAEGTEGEDVSQYQRLLATLGYSQTVADGKFGPATTAATKAWQKARGQEQSGVVGLGELVAVPQLPAALTLDRSIAWPGAALNGSENIINSVSGTPSFYMEITREQQAMIQPGMGIRVKLGEQPLIGITGEPEETEGGQVKVPVTAEDGGLLCGTRCGELPASQKAYLLTDIEIVPAVTGPTVPVSALSTMPDGTVSVRVVGEAAPRTVTVQTVAGGLAVVEGVRAGESVYALADAKKAGAPGGSGAPSGSGAPGGSGADTGSREGSGTGPGADSGTGTSEGSETGPGADAETEATPSPESTK